jgi:hypothetical protein
MKKHGYPKASDAKGEQRNSPANELPEDDLEVTPGKKVQVITELHPRCGIDRDDAETRDEYQSVEP